MDNEFCYWCSREGRGNVPATKDGGRFGPLCNKCANAIAEVFKSAMKIGVIR